VTIRDALRFADADASNYVAFKSSATVSSNITWTLPAADGTNGQVLSTNGSGTLSWASGGGGGSPGGSNTQVQFNDSGSFGGDSGLTYNKTTDVLTVSGGAVLQGLTAGRGAGAISSNTAFGTRALQANTTGAQNVAIGGGANFQDGALEANTIGVNNIAIGRSALTQNTSGGSNTCIGINAGYNVTTGQKNLSVYAGDLGGANFINAGGSTNIVTMGTADQEVFRFTSTLSTQLDGLTAGRGAGRRSDNAAFGSRALINNTTGEGNVAIGGGSASATLGALEANTIGSFNIAVGYRSLTQNLTGSSNTCIGFFAGYEVITGQKNLALYGGDRGNENRLAAGSSGIVTIGTVDAQRIRVNTDGFLVPLVHDQTTGSAANVFVASDGKMSRSTSSQRYKKNIQDAVHGLEKVLQLRPVTFNHINPDEAGIVYGGLIAEEVHDLGLTEFVEYTWDGRPDSLRYGHMVSLLVKAVQELNARVVALETQGA
jgi:hypothetical protein